MSGDHELRAERLNCEPLVFKGCSSFELAIIAGMSALAWLPASLVLCALAGAITMGFGIAAIGVVASVVVLAGLFQRIKRGRPDGYYQQRFLIALDARGLYRSGFTTSRTWRWPSSCASARRTA
ncbi:MAG: TIGR03750 family conjugal transfer protein [Proteobacteria bacterium]|nr:TIGR03750 family conjugal transfer protein [Pseudomonadota bacterium]